MDCFVTSNLRCALKINDRFTGISDGNLRKFSMENCDFPGFVEFAPEDNNFFSSKKILQNKIKKDLLQENTRGINVFPFQNGILLLPMFTKRPFEKFKVIYENKFDEIYVTVIADGFYKIIIQNSQQSFSACLDETFPLKISAEVSKDILLLKTIGKENFVHIYKIKDEIREILSLKCEKIEKDENFITIYQKKKGITKHQLIYKIPLEKDNEIAVDFKRSVPISLLSPLLTPFAFLEELKTNKGYEDFLCEDLKKYSEKVKDYFGNFFTFIPYNMAEKHCAVVLNKEAKRVFFVVERGKIKDFYFENQ